MTILDVDCYVEFDIVTFIHVRMLQSTSGTSAVVLFLLIAGTSYDIYLTKRVARKQNTKYDVEKHVKLERFVNGNSKLHNGMRH